MRCKIGDVCITRKPVMTCGPFEGPKRCIIVQVVAPGISSPGCETKDWSVEWPGNPAPVGYGGFVTTPYWGVDDFNLISISGDDVAISLLEEELSSVI